MKTLPPETFEERRKQETYILQRRPYRFFDAQFRAYAVDVFPGDCVVTDAADEMLVAVLGSCVAACVRDPQLGIGGMNHFMLPGASAKIWSGASDDLRYGHFAMEKLINDILAKGARRDQLEIKLYGGASLIRNGVSAGEENIAFIRRYLAEENLPVASEDLGGVYPRRIHFFAHTGKTYRLLMRRSDDAAIFNRELSFKEKLRDNPFEGTTELYTAGNDD